MPTTITRILAAVALLTAFVLGGVSARVWLAGPAAPQRMHMQNAQGVEE